MYKHVFLPCPDGRFIIGLPTLLEFLQLLTFVTWGGSRCLGSWPRESLPRNAWLHQKDTANYCKYNGTSIFRAALLRLSWWRFRFPMLLVNSCFPVLSQGFLQFFPFFPRFFTQPFHSRLVGCNPAHHRHHRHSGWHRMRRGILPPVGAMPQDAKKPTHESKSKKSRWHWLAQLNNLNILNLKYKYVLYICIYIYTCMFNSLPYILIIYDYYVCVCVLGPSYAEL